MEKNETAKLKTARLFLRPFTRNDQTNLFTLYGDPRVMEIRKIGLQTREQSDQRLEVILDQWRRRGFGYWGIFDQLSGDFFGDCGLREDPPNALYSKTEGIALSYGLIPKHWGKGLTTEAARAVVDFGFSEKGFNEVYAMTQKNNHASMRVLKKLGFKQCFEFNMDEKVVSRNRLSRSDWEKSE